MKIRTMVLQIAVIVCIIINCSGDDEKSPVSNQKNITLAGHVYYSGEYGSGQGPTTDPVNGVWVVLIYPPYGKRVDSMMTGPDGSFIFFDVIPGGIGFETWKSPLYCWGYTQSGYDESQNDIRIYFTTHPDCQ